MPFLFFLACSPKGVKVDRLSSLRNNFIILNSSHFSKKNLHERGAEGSEPSCDRREPLCLGNWC